MTDLDKVYDERNRCVALMARLALDDGTMAMGEYRLDAWLGRHEDIADPRETESNPWDPEWLNVVYVRIPTGQLSWHIHDRDVPLFAFLPKVQREKWDGHSTDEKYARMDAFANGDAR